MQPPEISSRQSGEPANQALDARAFNLRPGRKEDAAACGKICYEAFDRIAKKHDFPTDFPSIDAAMGLMSAIFANPRVYSVVAESEGHIIGSNFLWEDTIAGVGPITVDPAAQDTSIGRRLMQTVLDYCDRERFASVRLVQAAYHSRSLSLYAKLGFDVREPLATMQGPPIAGRLAGYEVRLAGDQDVDPCNSLCYGIHGHARAAELREAISQRTAAVVVRNGIVTGYATGVGFFGHAVGKTNEDLKALIAAAPVFAGPGFLLPTRNAELFRWCLEKGLRVVHPMTLMSKGLYNEPAGAFLPSVLY